MQPGNSNEMLRCSIVNVLMQDKYNHWVMITPLSKEHKNHSIMISEIASVKHTYIQTLLIQQTYA